MGRWERKPRNVLGGPVVGRMVDTAQGMPREISKALKRTRRMAQGDRISWADSSLSSIGRNLVDHSRDTSGTGDHLRAALLDAAALYACLRAAVDDLPPVSRLERLPSAADGVASVRQG